MEEWRAERSAYIEVRPGWLDTLIAATEEEEESGLEPDRYHIGHSSLAVGKISGTSSHRFGR